MDTTLSYLIQGSNYARLAGSRVVALAKKYKRKGQASFSTPRVPHSNPEAPPTALENAANTLKAFFMSHTLLLKAGEIQMFVGSGFNTAREYTYTKTNITHILNCADKDDVPDFYTEHVQRCLKIPMRDESDVKINFVDDVDIFRRLHEFLHDIFGQPRDATNPVNLLVHCVYGRSRSVSICMIILFLYSHHVNNPSTMVKVYEFIGQKRKVVALNRKFFLGLQEFETQFEQDEVFRTHWMGIFEE